MRLTQKSKYAVRALVEIAVSGQEGPLGVAEIARLQRIPERFLEQILCELRREGLLESRRGAHGGYRFAMPPEDIADAPLCVTSKVWDEAREALEGVFGRYSIAQLAETERESREGQEAAHATR